MFVLIGKGGSLEQSQGAVHGEEGEQTISVSVQPGHLQTGGGGRQGALFPTLCGQARVNYTGPGRHLASDLRGSLAERGPVPITVKSKKSNYSNKTHVPKMSGCDVMKPQARINLQVCAVLG